MFSLLVIGWLFRLNILIDCKSFQKCQIIPPFLYPVCKLSFFENVTFDLQAPQESSGTASRPPPLNPEPSDGLELQAALAKLSLGAIPPPSTRECSEIRKVKTAALPALEHVFAEGLYFTLTDMVLLPCIHHFLVRPHILISFYLIFFYLLL